MDCPCPGDASSLPVVDQKQDMVAIFVSFLVVSITMLACSVLGVLPPNPSVHWAGHAWIHFMKRLHVIMSIGCFLTELCSAFFSLFAIHRILFGGFSMQASSAAGVLLRELEFELVAVCSYFFTGWILLMGPVAIRCFCMAQQQLRSDSLAASVCCLFVGVGLLILSFFNAHLSSFPYGSYENIVVRSVRLPAHARPRIPPTPPTPVDHPPQSTPNPIPSTTRMHRVLRVASSFPLWLTQTDATSHEPPPNLHTISTQSPPNLRPPQLRTALVTALRQRGKSCGRHSPIVGASR